MAYENLLLVYANNKGADQTALPRSLIYTFIFRSLGRIIVIYDASKFTRLKIVFVVEQV